MGKSTRKPRSYAPERNAGDEQRCGIVRPADDPAPGDLHDIDLITFYFAYHDTTYMGIDRARMNKAMFAALKPGGFLIIETIQLGPRTAQRLARPITGLRSRRCVQRSRLQELKFVADAAFLRHPEDTRTNIVFRNPTPVDEFVLKFQKPM